MNRKTLLFVGGILALVIAGLVVFLVLNSKSKNAAEQQSTDTTNNTTTTVPDTTSKLQKVSDTNVVAPILSYDSKAVWYFTPDGHLYKLNLSTGLKQEFLLPSKLDIVSAVWPRAGSDFIIVANKSGVRSYNYYNDDFKDNTDQKFYAFPDNVKDLDFLPDGKSVLYNSVVGKNSLLVIGSYDLKTSSIVVNMPDKDLRVAVSPDGSKALAYNKNNPTDGKLYLVSIADKKIITTLKTSQENSALWSPDGKKFIWNKANGLPNNELWLGDANAPINNDIGLAGSVSKVAFSSDNQTAYIAAPDGSGDSFWKVDLSTLVKTKIFSVSDANGTDVHASNLLVSNDGATLYFKNSDGFLYSIPAK